MRRLRAKPQQATHRTAIIPAPTGGINETKTVFELAPNECIGSADATLLESSSDFISIGTGVSFGYGSTVWATTYSAGDSVARGLLGFEGSAAAKDRLWLVTEESIYDITASAASPAVDYTLPTAGSGGGAPIGCTYVTSAGHFFLYTDEVSGYQLYTESTDTWSNVAAGAGAGEIDGVDPDTFAFVTVWKNRVWFVEKSTARAWYLPVGQITGTVTSFNFGNKFPHGGTLVGLWNWTRDGGSGVDDFLVAVSTSGDVLVYQGNDPDTAGDFQCVGSWYVHAVPTRSRCIAISLGGELLLMTALGILPISRLVAGAPPTPDQFITYKIQRSFARAFKEEKALAYIGMWVHPRENALWVTLGAYRWRMSLSNGSWSENHQATYAAEWKGDLYFHGGNALGAGTLKKSTPGNLDVNSFTASAGTVPIMYIITAPIGVERPTSKTIVQARAIWTTPDSSADPSEAFRVTYRPERADWDAGTRVSGSGVWRGPSLENVTGTPTSGAAFSLIYNAAVVGTQILSRFEVVYQEGGLW